MPTDRIATRSWEMITRTRDRSRLAVRGVMAVALAASLSGCSALCGAEEEYAVGLGPNPTLTLTRGAGATPVEVPLQGRVSPYEIGAAQFDPVYRALTDGAGSSGILVSLGGEDPATHEQVTLTLLLPTPLRKGDTYPIGRAFAVPPEPAPSLAWGARAPARSGEAEVALSTMTYTFPPPAYHVQFQAASASGTVRVVDRYRGDGFSLALDVTATGADGRVFRLEGRISAVGERYTPPCT
jgi:hypothetical protein